jgi:delta-aminolevulinic acid dehydratase/porphobilinogen synthase
MPNDPGTRAGIGKQLLWQTARALSASFFAQMRIVLIAMKYAPEVFFPFRNMSANCKPLLSKTHHYSDLSSCMVMRHRNENN